MEEMRMITLDRPTSDAAPTAAPILRRASHAPVTARAPKVSQGAGPMSAAVRRALGEHELRTTDQDRTLRDVDVRGVFARAINAGIHDDRYAAESDVDALRGAAHGGEIAADAGEALGRASSGAPAVLPDELRGRFEHSIGTELGDVRIHTDASASAARPSALLRAMRSIVHP
jgi:hypothetical protein